MPDQEKFLRTIVALLDRYRLRIPALIFLDVASPLALPGAQVLWVAQPILSLFLPRTALEQLGNALEQPGALSELARRLERDHND